MDRADSNSRRARSTVLHWKRRGAEARALARRTDLALLPLAGVPVGVKDHVDVAGCPSRHGTAALSAALAGAEQQHRRRRRAAGGQVGGPNPQPERGQGAGPESVAFGVTRNPWNLEYTSGGSSGGSAAAVAAGMVPLALASGGGGSIRIPASCCGLVGLKPGPGLVPRTGPGWRGMSELGPIATTVADAALMLDVLAGTDCYRKAVAEPDRALRIGVTVVPPTPGVRVDPQVRVALEAANAGMIRTHLAASRLIPFLLPFNLARYPVVTIPAGRSVDGLPIGVQMAAAPGGEGLLLSTAAQLERLRPWPRHAPV
ncbi:amidase family protein [Nocardia sp. NPDC058497]|uniref:amidase family protein n=1 Tax=Nocardia sp. NPDC058497 TaxID=3346529 RepID=UPI00365FA660